MINVGIPGVEIVTSFDFVEVHPEELVTLKANTPSGRSDIVLLVPVLVDLISSGVRVTVHVPADGNPVNTTLPVGTAYVGWTIFSTTGAMGITGCAGITTLADGADKQLDALVTV